MMIQIRQATLSDAALIAAMSRETFYDTFAEFNRKEDMDLFLAGPFAADTLMAEVGRPGHFFFIAWDGDQPAGYVFLKDEMHPHIPNENAVEISRLYAKKAFIGKGIGKALMQCAVAHAVAENKTFIWLGVWEHNLRAIGFYQSFGFEKFSEHDFILGKDVQRDWLMRLKIHS